MTERTKEEASGWRRGDRLEEEESTRYLKRRRRRRRYSVWSARWSFCSLCVVSCFLLTPIISSASWIENKLFLLTLENESVWHVSVSLSFFYWIFCVARYTCDYAVLFLINVMYCIYKNCVAGEGRSQLCVHRKWSSRLGRWIRDKTWTLIHELVKKLIN